MKPSFPGSPPGVETSIPTTLGGRRKAPPPMVGTRPAARLEWRRRSPCSSFGGRLACSEFMMLICLNLPHVRVRIAFPISQI